MHCGQLILRKISKFDATVCQFLRLNAQNSISAGATPRPHWGSLQRSPDTLAAFKGPTSKGREGEEGKGRGRKKEGDWKRRREGMRREGRGRASHPNILA